VHRRVSALPHPGFTTLYIRRVAAATFDMADVRYSLRWRNAGRSPPRFAAQHDVTVLCLNVRRQHDENAWAVARRCCTTTWFWWRAARAVSLLARIAYCAGLRAPPAAARNMRLPTLTGCACYPFSGSALHACLRTAATTCTPACSLPLLLHARAAAARRHYSFCAKHRRAISRLYLAYLLDSSASSLFIIPTIASYASGATVFLNAAGIYHAAAGRALRFGDRDVVPVLLRVVGGFCSSPIHV